MEKIEDHQFSDPEEEDVVKKLEKPKDNHHDSSIIAEFSDMGNFEILFSTILKLIMV